MRVYRDVQRQYTEICRDSIQRCAESMEKLYTEYRDMYVWYMQRCIIGRVCADSELAVSYTRLRAQESVLELVCRLMPVQKNSLSLKEE